MAHPPMDWQVLPKSRDPNRASPLQKAQTGAASGPNRFRTSSSPSHSTCRTPNRFVQGLRVGWETFLSFEGRRASAEDCTAADRWLVNELSHPVPACSNFLVSRLSRNSPYLSRRYAVCHIARAIRSLSAYILFNGPRWPETGENK
jgi:hypothetical protein